MQFLNYKLPDNPILPLTVHSGIGGRRGAEDTRSHDARPDRRAKQSLGFQNCNTTMLYYKGKTITWLPELQYNNVILQRQNNHLASSADI